MWMRMWSLGYRNCYIFHFKRAPRGKKKVIGVSKEVEKLLIVSSIQPIETWL